MKKSVCVISCIILLHVSIYAFGTEPDDTGLITGGELIVPAVVLILQETEAVVGLTEATVLRELELRLLRHGIIPVDREAAHVLGWLIGIDILIIGSAYHVKVGIHWRVTHDVGDQTYGKEGITWKSWYTKVHDGD